MWRQKASLAPPACPGDPDSGRRWLDRTRAMSAVSAGLVLARAPLCDQPKALLSVKKGWLLAIASGIATGFSR